MDDKKYNSSDEQKVKDKAKKVRNEREQELEDVKTILKHPAGIRFFKRLIREGRIFSSTFTGNSQSFFLEGKRALVLKIYVDVVKVAPDKVPSILFVEKEGESE